MSTQYGRILINMDFLRSFKNTKNALPIRETVALRYRITSFGSTPCPCFDFKTFCEADHNFKSGPKASASLAWAFMCSLSLFPFHLELVLIAKSFLTKRSVLARENLSWDLDVVFKHSIGRMFHDEFSHDFGYFPLLVALRELENAGRGGRWRLGAGGRGRSWIRARVVVTIKFISPFIGFFVAFRWRARPFRSSLSLCRRFTGRGPRASIRGLVHLCRYHADLQFHGCHETWKYLLKISILYILNFLVPEVVFF